MVYFLLFPALFLKLLFLLQFKTKEGEGKTHLHSPSREKGTMGDNDKSRKNEDLNRSKDKAFLILHRFFACRGSWIFKIKSQLLLVHKLHQSLSCV